MNETPSAGGRLAGTFLGRLVFALPLFSFLLYLGGAPLFDVDEGAFSEATREMFERGDFLFTYLNGAPRFDKPIFIYWLQALGYLVFGASEWAFRLPSALAAVVWSYATWHFARERFGRDAALVALAVASTALGPFAIGRAATADALLNCLLALTLFDVWRHLESGARAPLLRAFLWMGLGALTKGPVALIVPAAVSLLYCASRGEWLRWARMVFNPLGWLLLVAIVAPWYLHAYARHGQDFIDGFIMRHNVQRFSGSLEGHGGSAFYYVLAVPLLLLPWSGLFFMALGRLREAFKDPLQRFLWLWFAFVLGFFSLSGTKLPHYVLYGCTPLFILIGLVAALAERDKVLTLVRARVPPGIEIVDGLRVASEQGGAVRAWLHMAGFVGAEVHWDGEQMAIALDIGSQERARLESLLVRPATPLSGIPFVLRAREVTGRAVAATSALPVHASAAPLPFRIRGVVGGVVPYVVLGDGAKLQPGGRRDGWRLVAVESDRLVFDGPRALVVLR